ncbi:MAG TPA: alpha-amylase family protein, partial [Candidatus Binataceae bacterium]
MTSGYQQGLRRMLVDMHIPDWDPAFLSKYDPAAMAKLFERARLTSVMLYCKSHAGLCYWPAKAGKMHAGLHGRDIVGDLLKELRARNIAPCAYYSIIFDNWAVQTHPDWRQRPVSGLDFRNLIRYGVCCPNHPEYLAYEMAQLDDLLSSYKFDALFLDMIFWPTICGCDHCRTRYRAESGREIPATVDWTSPQWCEFQTARESWIDEFTSKLMVKAQSVSPGIGLTHNLAPALADWVLAQPLTASIHDTFVAGDLYGDRVEQLVVSKLLLHLSETRPAEFMTSLCSDLSDHVRLKSEEQMRAQAAAATALSSGFLFIDAIDPVGTVNPAAYERVGRVFRDTEPYEPFIGGEPIEDVAVYFSGHSQMDFAENGKPASSFLTSSRKYPHLDAVRGACRALQRAHIPFGVVTRRQLRQLDHFRVLILANVLRLDTEETEAFRDFVRRGGRLYASRYTSLVDTSGVRHKDFMLSDVFGASYEGEEPGSFVYMKPSNQPVADRIAPQHFLSFKVTADPIRPPVDLCGIPHLKSAAAAKSLATLTVPFGYPARGSVNDHRWASI